ncbi:unnamed protein product [Polarella glacialis]|uniref:Uncharacterized protein n=1 Tax=Polarella glacialis TaxID=89957 RepID=A0A813G791_POLGL|nr:unnamed protein product [Polarella glacialis]
MNSCCSQPLVEGSGEKIVVITGCDSGIGQCLVEAAAAANFVVVAAHFQEQSAAATRTTYEGNGFQVYAMAADLTESVAPLVKVVETAMAAETGRQLWAVVNNAGVCISGLTELLPPDAYTKTMAINFHTPVQLVYDLLPSLKKTKGSRVINVTSIDGFISLPANAAYNASKHALEAYSDTLRVDMMPWDVKVAIIEPGTMKTPLALGRWGSWFKTFQEAPVDRRKPYGDAWATARMTDGTKRLEQIASDPMITVADIMDAIQSRQPKTHYRCGGAAKYFWWPLSNLPVGMRDAVLVKMAYPHPPDALDTEQGRAMVAKSIAHPEAP